MPALPRVFVHSIVKDCDWCGGSGQGSDYGGGPCYGCTGGKLSYDEVHPYPQTVEDCLFFAGQGARLAEAEALAVESIRRASTLAGTPAATPVLARWRRDPFLDSAYNIADSTKQALVWLASHGEPVVISDSHLDALVAGAAAFARVKARGVTNALDPFEPLLAIAGLGCALVGDRDGLGLSAARVTPELPWIARTGSLEQLRARLVTDPYSTVITIGRLQLRKLEPDLLDLVWRSEPKVQRAALRVVSSFRYPSSAMRSLHELLVDRGAARSIREAALDTMYAVVDRSPPARDEGAFEDIVDWADVQKILATGGLTLAARPAWFEATREVTRVTHTRFSGDREREVIIKRAGRVEVNERGGGQRSSATTTLAHGTWTRLMTALVAAGFPAHVRSDPPGAARIVIAWQAGNSVTTIALHDAGPYETIGGIVDEILAAAQPAHRIA